MNFSCSSGVPSEVKGAEGETCVVVIPQYSPSALSVMFAARGDCHGAGDAEIPFGGPLFLLDRYALVMIGFYSYRIGAWRADRSRGGGGGDSGGRYCCRLWRPFDPEEGAPLPRPTSLPSCHQGLVNEMCIIDRFPMNTRW